jgi:hypothetical protein
VLGRARAFVAGGWFTTALGADPRRMAISQDGELVEGDIAAADATASFE